jgi:hypothetical protein
MQDVRKTPPDQFGDPQLALGRAGAIVEAFCHDPDLSTAAGRGKLAFSPNTSDAPDVSNERKIGDCHG